MKDVNSLVFNSAMFSVGLADPTQRVCGSCSGRQQRTHSHSW